MVMMVHEWIKIYFLFQWLLFSREKNWRKFIKNHFFLKVAYAITMHWSEGLTLELIVIHFDDHEFVSGLTFVDLSSLKKFFGLNIYLTYIMTKIYYIFCKYIWNYQCQCNALVIYPAECGYKFKLIEVKLTSSSIAI